MDRPFEWRYANPFRVTPGDKPGAGHWEGSGFHWEQSGSGYIQVAGDVWYELAGTFDEGYDVDNSYYDPDTERIIEFNRNPRSGTAQSEVGDTAFFDGYEWTVYRIVVDITDSGGSIDLFYNRTETVPGAYHQVINHVAVYFDYWNAWVYRNLEWVAIASGIRRPHV